MEGYNAPFKRSILRNKLTGGQKYPLMSEDQCLFLYVTLIFDTFWRTDSKFFSHPKDEKFLWQLFRRD
jgi:5-methylthioribose kinase